MRVVRSHGAGWVGVTALLVAASLVLGFAPGRTDAGAAELRPVEVTTRNAPELRRDFLDLTNDDRAEHDRDALRLARRLSRYAREHSREMADLGYIFHSSDDELRRALEGTDWDVAGENVGVGGSLADLEDAFMASAPHRRNLLAGGFDRAAIGVVVDYDRVWVTVVFYGD